MNLTPESSQNAKYGGLISFGIFTLMPLVFSSVISFYLYKYQAEFSQFGTAEWLLISILFTIGMALAITPVTVVAFVMGYFLKWGAIKYLIFMIPAAIALVYLIYKILNFSWIENWLKQNEKARAIIENIRKEELKMIFFAKLSPVFPFVITNLIIAISGASLKNMIIGGFGGVFPGTLLGVYLGAQAQQLKQLIDNPNESEISKLIISVLLVVSFVGLFTVFKKAVKK